jgi:hypothetical protein
MEDILSDEDELKLILAAAMAKHPEPFSSADTSPVIAWARHVRLGDVMLELTLVGEFVPVGVKPDGDIGFRTVSGVLSRSDAKRYRTELEEIRMNSRVCDDCLVKQALGDMPPQMITPPMEGRLQLAVQAGQKWRVAKRVEMKHMLDFAQEVLSEVGQLQAVLAGHLLPVSDPHAKRIAFRKTSDLKPDFQENYREKLKVIERKCADSTFGSLIPWEMN